MNFFTYSKSEEGNSSIFFFNSCLRYEEMGFSVSKGIADSILLGNTAFWLKISNEEASCLGGFSIDL
jgi:hypothetical protein